MNKKGCKRKNVSNEASCSIAHSWIKLENTFSVLNSLRVSIRSQVISLPFQLNNQPKELDYLITLKILSHLKLAKEDCSRDVFNSISRRNTLLWLKNRAWVSPF